MDLALYWRNFSVVHGKYRYDYRKGLQRTLGAGDAFTKFSKLAWISFAAEERTHASAAVRGRRAPGCSSVTFVAARDGDPTGAGAWIAMGL